MGSNITLTQVQRYAAAVVEDAQSHPSIKGLWPTTVAGTYGDVLDVVEGALCWMAI